jgi:hypothetical protein
MAKVKIQVENQDKIYDIPCGWLQGSQTLQHLLDYQHDQNNNGFVTPVHIGVSTQDWLAYLDFLENNQASIPALTVIDYLDNVEQARSWYRQMIKQGNKQHTVDIMLENTSFTTQDMFPFVSKFQLIHPYIKDNLTKLEVKDIIMILYPNNHDDIYKLYLKTFTYSSLNPLDMYIPDKFYNKLLANGFIAIQQPQQYKHYLAELFPFDKRGLSLYCKGLSFNFYPQVISGDVAAYYQVPVSGFNNMWWYCPSPQNPYLSVTTRKGKFVPCCQSTSNSSTYHKEMITVVNNKFNPNDGYDTSIKIENYSLICLNTPSTQDLSYDLYVVLLNDPISKKLFAISI